MKGPVQVAVEKIRVGQRGDRTEIDATFDPGTLAGVVQRERGSDLDVVATTGPIVFSMQRSAETTGRALGLRA